jgi:hypothetical protein
MRSLIVTLAVGLCFSPAAKADLIHYSAFGTFDSSVPNISVGGSDYTAQNGSWAFSFDVDKNPLVATFGGPFFLTEFFNWSYQLNGVDTGLTPFDIVFFCDCADGMFEIDFDSNDFIGFTGPEMFTGPLDSPTMLSGSFTDLTNGFDDNFFIDDPLNPGNLLDVQSNDGVVVTATPEPSTWGMLVAGGFALAALRRRRAV